MHKKIIDFNLKQRTKKIPDLKAGDIVKVHRKIKEGEKERTQVFEGIVIAINGKQSSSPTITVRKVSFGVGVELILPVHSPQIEKIEIVKRAKVRRAKLYYIRNKSAKSLRMKYKDMAEFAKEESKKEIKEEPQEGAEEKSEEKGKEEVSTEVKEKVKAEKKEEVKK